MNKLTLLLIGSLCISNIIAQTDIATIPLDAPLHQADEILPFPDDQGNLLFQFRNQNHFQFSLLDSNFEFQSQRTKFPGLYDLLDCLYNNQSYSLYYQKNGKDEVYLHQFDKQPFALQSSTTNIGGAKEKHLAVQYIQGNFRVFNFTKSPFTLHTYALEDGKDFNKTTQVFESPSKERFWGKIQLEDELIVVRLSRKLLQMHLYRYFADRGFVKQSIDLKQLYKKAGINKISALNTNDISIQLSAFMQEGTLYMNMEPIIGTGTLKGKNRRVYPGVLRYDWGRQKAQIVQPKSPEFGRFKNRSVAMLGKLYFKLLVNRKKLQLSIFDLEANQLAKVYTYEKHQPIDLIHGEAQKEKLSTFFAGGVRFDLQGNKKPIETSELLRDLSGESMDMEVYDQNNVIEIYISGANEKAIFNEVALVNFVGFLSKADLSIYYPNESYDNSSWKQMEEYLDLLQTANKQPITYTFYPYKNQVHLAYIDQEERHCRIIAF